MTQRASVSIILVHIVLWTLYSIPVSLSNSPEYVIGFDKHQRKFNLSVEIVSAKPPYHDKNSEYNVKAHSEVDIEIIPIIAENVFYHKKKCSKKKQLGLASIELLKPYSLGPVNLFHHLIRRRRSDAEPASGNLDKNLEIWDPNASLDLPVSKNATNSSTDDVAISKAFTSVNKTLSRLYDPGSSISQAEALAENGYNATARAKAQEKNASALATSLGGGNAVAASESGRDGTALSTSISEGNGSSRAVATVVEGHAIAMGYYEVVQSDSSHTNDYPPLRPAQEIDFDDPFFQPGFKPTVNQFGTNDTSVVLKNSTSSTSTTKLNSTSSTTKLNSTTSTTKLKSPTSTTKRKNASPKTKLNSTTSTRKLSRPTSKPKLNILTSTTELSNLSPTTEFGIRPTTSKPNIPESTRKY